METALMKLLAAISTTTLFLLLGVTAAAYAPQERQEQGDKPEKQGDKAKPEKKEPQAKPAKQEQENKPVKQETKQASQEKRDKPANEEPKRAKQEPKDEPAKHEAKQEQKEEPAKRETKQAKQEQSVEHVKQQDQQSVQHSRTDGERPGGSHGRISDEHYRASFGSGHNFHVNRGDYDHHRFSYGGYSFGFLDPWPDSWYYTDNVYVVYEGGGYYMYDAIHPGMRISVNIL
jgi:hypothetical protein